MADLGTMLGLPADALGHLTGGGTVANLEASVGRPPGDQRAADRRQRRGAHYTHARMAGVLGVDCRTVDGDDDGRMDLGRARGRCSDGRASGRSC